MPTLMPDALRRGDILVSVANPRDLLHLGIAAALASPYVHCTTYIGGGKELSTVPQGLQIRPLTDPFQVVCRYMGSPRRADAAVDLLTSMIGQPYNFVGAAAIGVEKLTGQAPPPWARGPYNAKFCSEGVSSAWVQVGDDLLPWVEDGRTCPGDFLLSQKLSIEGLLIR